MKRIDIGTLSSRRARIYALLIATGALLWIAGLLSHAGNSLPDPRAQKFYRFCGGKCLCDGGVANASLMARVCPEGWQDAYGVARQKRRRFREWRREQQRKRLRATPPRPETPSGPNV